MPSGTEPAPTDNPSPVPPVRRAALEYPISPVAMDTFVEALGYEFRDPTLLGQSLTHRSWCAEHAGFESNERLEFLGDAVLGLVVTDEIYRNLPEAGEGHLSRIRAEVVCSPALADMASELGIGSVLLLGKGEDSSGGRQRQSILADALEAVIGAMYIDGGEGVVRDLVDQIIGPRLAGAGTPDHKSRLHELAAQRYGAPVTYLITETGPEHDKTFEAEVRLGDDALGSGTGRSKKSAEQAAARQAWQTLAERRGDDPTREDTDG